MELEVHAFLLSIPSTYHSSVEVTGTCTFAMYRMFVLPKHEMLSFDLLFNIILLPVNNVSSLVAPLHPAISFITINTMMILNFI